MCYMADKHKAAGKPAVMSLQPLPEQLGKGNSILPSLGAWPGGIYPLATEAEHKMGLVEELGYGEQRAQQGRRVLGGVGVRGLGAFSAPLSMRGAGRV